MLVVKQQEPGEVYFCTDLNSLPRRAGWQTAHWRNTDKGVTHLNTQSVPWVFEYTAYVVNSATNESTHSHVTSRVAKKSHEQVFGPLHEKCNPFSLFPLSICRNCGLRGRFSLTASAPNAAVRLQLKTRLKVHPCYCQSTITFLKTAGPPRRCKTLYLVSGWTLSSSSLLFLPSL